MLIFSTGVRFRKQRNDGWENKNCTTWICFVCVGAFIFWDEGSLGWGIYDWYGFWLRAIRSFMTLGETKDHLGIRAYNFRENEVLELFRIAFKLCLSKVKKCSRKIISNEAIDQNQEVI